MATSSTPLNNPSSTRRKRAAYAMPLVAIIAISSLMALMFYPMMNAQVRELPVAVLSLDEGASTPQGEMNVGSTLVTKLTDNASTNGDETPMHWTEVKSQDDLDSAFADHEYYAAITIPTDFTAKQVAAKQASVKSQIDSATALAQTMAKAQAEAEQQGLTGAAAQQHVQAALQNAITAQSADATPSSAGGASSTSSTADAKDAPTVTLTIDNAKSPLVASLLKQSVPAMLEQTGATVTVNTINESDVKSNSSLPTDAMMGQNMLIMPVYMMSLIIAVLTYTQLRRKHYDAKPQRWASFGVQLLAALGWSLMIALGACSITAMVGAGWPPTSMIAFLWLASLALIAMLLSLMNIALPLGVICGALGLGLGMTSGMFPHELLPGFWQDWVYGWVPQHYIGAGVRAILYGGDGWWNAGSTPLVIMLCVGLAIFVIADLLPLGRQRRRGRD